MFKHFTVCVVIDNGMLDLPFSKPVNYCLFAVDQQWAPLSLFNYEAFEALHRNLFVDCGLCRFSLVLRPIVNAMYAHDADQFLL